MFSKFPKCYYNDALYFKNRYGMLIKNIYIYDDDGCRHLKHLLITKDGSQKMFNYDDDLSHLIEADLKILDANGCHTLFPGLLDPHVHGQGGFDFADVSAGEPESRLQTIVSALGETGLSYAFATVVSLPLAELKQSLEAINSFVEKEQQKPTAGFANIVGVHLEGPFISKNCKGAHAEDALQDSIDMEQFRAIINAAPAIRQWKITLAPDLPGAIEFIRQTKDLEQEGIFVKVFIGHSNPDNKAVIERAIKAGAIGFTHLGNACQESCSRESRELELTDPTSHVVQWILENPDSCPPGIELIVDGVHLSPSFVSLISGRVGNKIILVTDALGPAGCDDGLYKLGSLDIRKEGISFFLTDSAGNFLMKAGTLANGEKGMVKSLAGSAAPLSLCIEKYVQFIHEENLEKRMTSLYKATIINPRTTSLSSDAIADLPDINNFVIVNNKGQLVLSSCNGRIKQHKEIPVPKAGSFYSSEKSPELPITELPKTYHTESAQV